jgi:hypothetical protein
LVCGRLAEFVLAQLSGAHDATRFSGCGTVASGCDTSFGSFTTDFSGRCKFEFLGERWELLLSGGSAVRMNFTRRLSKKADGVTA